MEDYIGREYLFNSSKHFIEKAEKALAIAKENEKNDTPPEGYKWKWVDGGLRSKKRVLVKISNQ